MKVLSLFDGISCARVALERSGVNVETYYASEIDEHSIKIAGKNFPDTIHIGDVRNIFGDDRTREPQYIFVKENKGVLTSHFTGGIDLLIGGSPCQDLSIANTNREGLAGKRSGLFWQYVRVLNEVQPKYFILENVASMPKEAKKIITETLGVEPIMIDAALVGAQRRKRLFWTNIPNVEQPKDREIYLHDILETDVDEKYFIKGEALEKIFEKMRQGTALPQSQRIYGTDGKSVSLQAGGGGIGAKTGLYVVGLPRGYNKGSISDKKTPTLTTSKWEHNNFIVRVINPNLTEMKKSRTVRVSGRGSGFLDRHNWDTIGIVTKSDEFMVRKLTPVECERLQAVPDNYTEGASDAQRYKMLGNAFNADVVAHIISHI